MRKIKYILAAAVMTFACNTTAQYLNSAYFLDGYANGHQLNPAKDYDRGGYVGLPFLNNFNTALRGNIGVKDILYKNPNGQGLVSFLHPSITSKEAMDAFHDKNKLLLDMRLDIFNAGFHAFGGFNTISLSARSNAGINVPYELFDLTKNLSNKDYDIREFGATAKAWAELAFGHSHQINDAWRIGAKAKLLFGVGYINMEMNGLRLDLSNDNQWTATADATIEAGVKNFKWGNGTETKEYKNQYPGHMTYQQLDIDPDVDKVGMNGFGLGLDLGVEWDMGKQDLVEGLKLSASLLDLGFIKWSDVAIAQNRGDAFVFNGFHNIQVDDGPGEPLDDQSDDLGDRLADLYSMQDGGTTSKSTGIGTTLNLAAEYALPSYKKLKFGLLSTTRLQGVYGWNEERLSVTLSPCKLFELSTSAAVGTFGGNLGWVLNFHPQGFSLFIGADHCIGKFTKQWVPLRSNYDFSMGIAIPFGKSRIGQD
ncbi:MAG: DUF5723 family protein [Bacteroidaceae bacterium]|nr:DUF5723 family protein [Bacteroidaceae bacterium]